MEYTLGPEESTLSGIRRVAREQLEGALLELRVSGEPVDARIHSVRKRMKKLRGLLRLVELSMDEDAFDRENDCFRSVANQLASARRAAALIGSLDALFARGGNDVEAAAREAFRARLVEERDRAVEAVHGERHEDARGALELALARLDEWPLTGDGWELVAGGFQKSYSRGRRSFRRAMRDTTAENLHEWRRWAKYHWYHLRLLSRVWPAVMNARSKTVDELGEILGAEHDLDDLRRLLVDAPPPEQLMDQLSKLLGLLEERRSELRSAAFALGARIYAERAGANARRMREYFLAATPGAR